MFVTVFVFAIIFWLVKSCLTKSLKGHWYPEGHLLRVFSICSLSLSSLFWPGASHKLHVTTKWVFVCREFMCILVPVLDFVSLTIFNHLCIKSPEIDGENFLFSWAVHFSIPFELSTLVFFLFLSQTRGPLVGLSVMVWSSGVDSCLFCCWRPQSRQSSVYWCKLAAACCRKVKQQNTAKQFFAGQVSRGGWFKTCKCLFQIFSESLIKRKKYDKALWKKSDPWVRPYQGAGKKWPRIETFGEKARQKKGNKKGHQGVHSRDFNQKQGKTMEKAAKYSGINGKSRKYDKVLQILTLLF